MAAAVPLALAVLEAAVPLADLESDFVVLDTAADVFVGDALEDVEDVSAWNVSCQSGCPARQDQHSSYHSLGYLASVGSSLLYPCMMAAMAKLR